MNDMTPRQRMLAAYQRKPVDRVPVAPSLLYYIAARVFGMNQIELKKRYRLWQLQHRMFKHYGCDGYGGIGLRHPGHTEAALRAESRPLDDGALESRTVTSFRGRSFVERTVTTAQNPAWIVERPVKDFAADWPLWEEYQLWDLDRSDWSPIESAFETVGEDFLLEVVFGAPFLDFVGAAREGGLEQLVVDLAEHEPLLRASQRRYIDWARRFTRAAFTRTPAQVIYIGCSWSCNSLIGPRLWREWDKPVIAAVAEEAHRMGRLVHIHFHGRCMETVSDFAELEIDCVDPFERPPGGDVTDLRSVRDTLRGRVTVMGNVHTVETLIRGTPADVRREVQEIMDAWEGGLGLIIGTGDQVGGETPEENLRTLISCGKSLSQY